VSIIATRFDLKVAGDQALLPAERSGGEAETAHDPRP